MATLSSALLLAAARLAAAAARLAAALSSGFCPPLSVDAADGRRSGHTLGTRCAMMAALFRISGVTAEHVVLVRGDASTALPATESATGGIRATGAACAAARLGTRAAVFVATILDSGTLDSGTVAFEPVVMLAVDALAMAGVTWD